jgi:iron complex outermembrane receptor protein
MVSSIISHRSFRSDDKLQFSGKLKLRRTIMAVMALSAAAALSYSNAAFAQETTSTQEPDGEVADLSDVTVTDDPMRALSNEPSAASFGFAKPLLETPRTVTFVSEEQLRLFGVSSVEDLSRLVPGTYTTTRFGLQGGINVRGVTADFYYRGVKRLQMQGHVRTVLSAYDNIEVIKGPPSPLYGMGQIGGYANLDPKSNRAKTGKYMTKEQGYLQATSGKYNKGEMQFGLGVPFTIAGKTSGIYVVGLLEDSDTFVRNVDAHQKFLQATMSVDNAVGPFRLEMGGQMQNSITAGNFFSRTSEDFVENGIYVTGRPLAQLDLNQDGRVGYVETYLGSPVTGSISGNNQALDQRYAFPQDANGNPVDINSYANSIVGIPKSMHDYLNSEAGLKLDCAMADYMRTMPVAQVGGDSLVRREIPVGFVLDPCTTGLHQMSDDDYRETGAWEREQNATQRMFYLDLIYDTNPDFTVKNQFFYDSINSFKDSWLPYGENQEIHMWEDKVTATYRIPSEHLPDWLTVNTLGSLNYRDIKGWIRSSGGDFDWRQDITYHQAVDGSGTGGFYPNTMFWTQLTNPDYQTGVPNTQDRNSEYTEKGVGLMFDMEIFRKTTLTLGARYDHVDARAMEMASFNPNTGNIGVPAPEFITDYMAGLACEAPGGTCPGAWQNPGPWVSEPDRGTSWSVSLAHKLPWANMVPYITMASSTITLDAANNMYAVATITGDKLVGDAGLTEVGIKGTAFGSKAQWTLAAFEQERTDVQSPSDPSLSAYAQSTRTEGVEASLNMQPTRKWFVGMSVTYLDPRYIQGSTSDQVRVDARDLGFQDIVLPTGEIYPAEAFGYGGKFSLPLVDPNNVYDEVPGMPDVQAALNTTYNIGMGFGLLANIQYFSDFWVDRIHSYKLPENTQLNIGVTWDSARIHLKGNVYNLEDETYFRTPSSGDATRLSVMPDRRWEISLKVDF